MALNTKGKKTSLTEEASIYQKRQDDLSDKERIKNMTGKQKRDFFKTYYLPKLLVILAVAGVVFYIVWVDFINKSDRKSTRLNSSHNRESRMPSSA